MTVRIKASRGELVHEVHGYHEIAQAKYWEKDLTEAARQNHGVRVVLALDRRNWTAGKPILAIVVVFEDQKPPRPCGATTRNAWPDRDSAAVSPRASAGRRGLPSESAHRAIGATLPRTPEPRRPSPARYGSSTSLMVHPCRHNLSFHEYHCALDSTRLRYISTDESGPVHADLMEVRSVSGLVNFTCEYSSRAPLE
jgi:hypothetical protein